MILDIKQVLPKGAIFINVLCHDITETNVVVSHCSIEHPDVQWVMIYKWKIEGEVGHDSIAPQY